MVKSTGAAVAGNWPSQDKRSQFELISFLGQVKVKVKGKVNAGDYIVPSGLNDGVGIAISESNLASSDRLRILGRAWESSSILTVKPILVAVGSNFTQASLHDDLARVNQVYQELDKLKKEQQALLNKLNSTLDQQDAELESLIQEVEKMKSKTK